MNEVDVERQRAVRALLRHPLIARAGQWTDEYVLVRRHSEWLKSWFEKFPAWTLYVDRDVARLYKTAIDRFDDTRPAVDPETRTPFSRRTYALFCLVLAVLEESPYETSRERIAEAIAGITLEDDERIFDPNNSDHRRDLSHALNLLADLGALGNPAVAAVYDRGRSRTIDIVGGHRPPLQQKLFRILLDSAVLYYDELDDTERTYLDEHRSYLLRQINEATGFIAEVRREGIALVDPEAESTDFRLTQWLAKSAAIPLTTLEEQFGPCHDAIFRLRGLRLVNVINNEVIPLPACRRYAAGTEV